MTNAELIKALRWCGDESDEWCVRETYKCPLWNEDRITDECKAELMRAAADALEAAEKRIAELSLDNKMLKNTIDADKGVMLERIRFLEAQLQKHGEWIVDKKGYPQIICSICDVHIPVVAGWCMDAHINYCPNCGARMKKGDK